MPQFSGFPVPEEMIVEQANNVVLNSSEQSEQNSAEQSEMLVEQGLNSSEQSEQNSAEQFSRTIVEQPNSAVHSHHRTVENKVILTVPPEDVQQWRHYAKIYYRRSLKASSSEATRERNRERYLEYRGLLETAGVVVVELSGTLKFE